MKYSKKENGLVYIKKCCNTCGFMMYDHINNVMVCAGNSKGAKPYGYGDEIKDKNCVCGNYEISFNDFCKLDSNQQWSHLKYLY